MRAWIEPPIDVYKRQSRPWMGTGEIMLVTLNKKEMMLKEGMTVSELIKQRKMRKAAVWINGRQLLSAEYETCVIQEGDEIRLLRIMAGG